MDQFKSIAIRNNSGFTLLEIIAVMVIMSILAVVAVPKYFDLQSEAKNKAMETAMAESIGRVNSWFAKEVLAGKDPDTIEYSDDTLGTDLGDFTLATIDGGAPTVSEGDSTTSTGVDCSTATAGSISASDGSGCIELTVSAKTGTAVSGADDLTDVIPRPGRI